MTAPIDIAPETEALIFDCDGTLVDTLPLYLAAWQAALSDLAGLDLPSEWYADKGGYAEQMLLSAAEQDSGVTLDRAAIVAAARRGVTDRLPDVLAHEPVVALARAWAGRLPLAVASSGSREVVTASLAAIGLLDVFEVIVTIEDVTHPKPAPDIYQLAARRLGVSPERCVVFEDSREGIKAAHAAGMTAHDVRSWSSAG